MFLKTSELNPTQALLRALDNREKHQRAIRDYHDMTIRIGLWLHRLDARLSRGEDTLAQRMRIVAFFVACPSLCASNFALAVVLLVCERTLMGGVAMLVVLAAAGFNRDGFLSLRARRDWLACHSCYHAVTSYGDAHDSRLVCRHCRRPHVERHLCSARRRAASLEAGHVCFRCLWSHCLYCRHHCRRDHAPVPLLLRAEQSLAGHLRTAVFAVNVLLPVLMMVLAILYYDVRFAGEQINSDELLYRIMPRNTAAQLKSGVPRRALVERYDSVTCFFADIVGYTSLASMHTAGETIAILDRLYEKMDAVALRFGVYKVATIGDAYFAVAGCPVASDAQIDAIKMAQFALAVRDSLATEVGVRVRIGLHSGPVVAGVIGELAPQFTLVGDTVTTTSLVESQGQAGRIHCSHSTYQLLCDRFEFGTRSPIRLKGSRSRKTQTYWLLGVNDDRGPRRPAARRAAKRRLSESAPVVPFLGFGDEAGESSDDMPPRRLSVSVSVPSSGTSLAGSSLANSSVSPRRRSVVSIK
jgi:class 3 adenylate cyclase